MLAVLLVPLIKSETGKLYCMNSDRLITLANVLFKVSEIILLDILKDFILSVDKQFGLKAKHGTDNAFML